MAGVNGPVLGSFTYSPAAGTILHLGKAQALRATFTPADPNDYTTASASATIDVDAAAPAIAWPDPGDIRFGTALSTTQLDASTSVPGTFTYTPALGTILQAGAQQTLSVRFVPSDSTNYRPASASVTINVDPLRPTLSLSDSGGLFDGSAYPASVTITPPGGGASPTASLGGTVPTLSYFVGIGTSGTSLGATPPASPGTYTVVASFAGSVDYAPIQSAPLTFAIALDRPTIGISTSSGSTLYGQTVTLTVSVAVSGHTPGGTISFFDGTTALGRARSTGRHGHAERLVAGGRLAWHHRNVRR